MRNWFKKKETKPFNYYDERYKPLWNSYCAERAELRRKVYLALCRNAACDSVENGTYSHTVLESRALKAKQSVEKQISVYNSTKEAAATFWTTNHEKMEECKYWKDFPNAYDVIEYATRKWCEGEWREQG